MSEQCINRMFIPPKNEHKNYEKNTVCLKCCKVKIYYTHEIPKEQIHAEKEGFLILKKCNKCLSTKEEKQHA